MGWGGGVGGEGGVGKRGVEKVLVQVINDFIAKAGGWEGQRRCCAAVKSTCYICTSYIHFPPTL